MVCQFLIRLRFQSRHSLISVVLSTWFLHFFRNRLNEAGSAWEYISFLLGFMFSCRKGSIPVTSWPLSPSPSSGEKERLSWLVYCLVHPDSSFGHIPVCREEVSGPLSVLRTTLCGSCFIIKGGEEWFEGASVSESVRSSLAMHGHHANTYNFYR